jgi:hypothetical protein
MASLRSALGLLLRVFAYLFELALSLFLIGLGLVAWASGSNTLVFGTYFWEGVALIRAILILGIVGLACVLLAGSRLRWIFPLWCLFVLVLMIRGFFLSSYAFRATEFQFATWLTTAALLAFLGSLTVFGAKRSRRR